MGMGGETFEQTAQDGGLQVSQWAEAGPWPPGEGSVLGHTRGGTGTGRSTRAKWAEPGAKEAKEGLQREAQSSVGLHKPLQEVRFISFFLRFISEV